MLHFFEDLIDPYSEAPMDTEPPQKLLPFLVSYLAPFKKLIALNLIAACAVAGAEIGLIYYLGRLVDLLSVSSPTEFWANYKIELVFVVIFVLLLRPFARFMETALIKNAIQPNVAALGRWRSHKHVLRQPVGWFESDFAGRIANRVVQMPAAAGDLAFQTMDGISFLVAYVIGAAILLSNANPQLLIPLVLWVLIYTLFLRWALGRIRPAARASSAARSKTLGLIVDTYTNIHSVKLFSHDKRETDYAYGILENHRKTYMAENRIVTKMDACLIVLNGLLIVAVVGWALKMWSEGMASVGVVAAAGTLALRINSMTAWFMGILAGVMRALGIISEGMESVAQPIRMLDSEHADALSYKKGAIEICSLSHHYGRGTGGIYDVSLSIKPGEKIALVGRSGAGKSTLVKALLRLFDPEDGQILIDGTDIKSVTQASLRAQIGMVQQESSLLHRSIKDNLIYGCPDATFDDVVAAAKKAAAHDFIADLYDSGGNKGYDAQVGERGVKLSGGQRQRIALARVILKDAPILILDEATSALDSEVEAEIQKTLYGMMEGKTVIAIAHRLSTIAQMDRIIVLDDGKLAEEGTHDELVNADGLYASLWARQSGGFIAS